MCDPITLASLALTVGSVAANTVASNQALAARNDVLRAERIRQKGFDKRAAAINEGSRDRYANFAGEQTQRATQLGDAITTAPATSDANAAAGTIMPSTSSNVVARETAARMADANAYTQQQGEALGALRAFGDLFGEKSRLQGRDATLVDQIGGFKKASAGIVPIELDAASHAGDSMKLLGDILGGLGSVGTTYGITRGGSGVTNTGSAAAARAADRASVSGYAAPSVSSWFRF